MHTPIVAQVEGLYQYKFPRANPRFPFVWSCGHNALVVPLVLLPFSARLPRLSTVVPQGGGDLSGIGPLLIFEVKTPCTFAAAVFDGCSFDANGT